MELQQLCMGCMEDKGYRVQCSQCGYAEDAAPKLSYYLQPRTVLHDKYLVGRTLGQGGFAITYLAWDVNLGIKLAIKEYFPIDLVYRIPGEELVAIHSQAQDTIFANNMEKFLQEARALARFIDHPNIVSVTDFFQANRTAYLVMHYIEGVTLRDHLGRSGEKLPFNLTMEIMMPVMDALRVIHEAGLLHRDISPENVFISKGGRVILIDFGAVRRSTTANDNSVSVVMKPGYTPEEQYRSYGVQGPPTDMYATAATIYRTITGKMPPNSLDRLDQDNLIPPSELGVEIKPEQEEALLKAMAVNAGDRFKNIADFQQALLKGKSAGKSDEKVKPEKQQEKRKMPEDQKLFSEGMASDQGKNKEHTSDININIGRADSNDIILEDDTVSRYHARIFSHKGIWYIADLDSTHGTTLNDIPVQEPLALNPSDKIAISNQVFIFNGKGIVSEDGNLDYDLVAISKLKMLSPQGVVAGLNKFILFLKTDYNWLIAAIAACLLFIMLVIMLSVF